jgi:8-oxo-dGTP diphosphatase
MPKSEQGVTKDRYMIIPRTLIFVTHGDRVLLIKGAPTKRLWANKYNGIGGHIERGEDALSAARRELDEETGLIGVNLRLVGTVLIDAGEQTGIGLFVFHGEVYKDESQLVNSPEGTLEWVLYNQLSRYPLVEDLPILLPKIMEMKPGDAPFAALYYYDANDRMQVTFGDTK